MAKKQRRLVKSQLGAGSGWVWDFVFLVSASPAGCGAGQPGARLPLLGTRGGERWPLRWRMVLPRPAAAPGAGTGFTPLIPSFISLLYSC